MPVDPGNTFATALNLGNLSGNVNTSFANFVGGSDIDDYLRFTLSSSSSVTLSLSGLQGDADLGLLNSAGQLLGASINPGAEPESITLNNLAPGNYYVWINAFQGAITNYVLGFQGTGGSAPEPGSILATALDLGGFNYVQHTQTNSVNGVSDLVDLYRFELNGASDINLGLTNLNGDADIAILNELGTAIAISDQSGNTAEQIVTTLAAGVYYVQVSAFEFNPVNYTVNLEIALEDNAGNTLATARKINSATTTLDGTFVFNDYLSSAAPGSPDTDDFYRFHVLTQTNYNITISGLSTDIDLQLVQDLNNNGIIEVNEVIASSILPGTAPESISGVVNEGTYFIRVYPFSRAAGAYTLTVNASPQDFAGNSFEQARNIGNLVGDRSFSDFVGISDTNDYYRFNLATASNVELSLTQLQADADIELFNSAGTLITFSENTGTNSELISRTLGAGSYYVRVYPYLGTTNFPLNSNTNYTLNLSAVPITDGAGNTLNTAFNLGVLGSNIVISDYVGSNDLNDFFQFALNTGSNFNLTLTDLIADADVQLIRDFNNNGIVDANEVLASSTLGGNASEAISTVLTAGNYFVRVYPFSGNTSYTLTLGASPIGDNTLSTANNLGTLNTETTVTGFVGSSDTQDFYRFALNGNRAVSLALSNLSADADLQLIRDFNNNGIVDQADILASSVRGNSASEFILRDLSAGTYFVRVYQYIGNTNYSLTLTPLVDAAGNTLASAFNLGTVSGSRTVNEVIGSIDTNDLYRFNVSTLSRLDLNLNGLDAYANAQLIQDLNGNGAVENNEIIAATTRSVGDFGASSLSATVNPGTYFVRVIPDGGADTRYELGLTVNSLIADGAGNTLATARNLGTLSSPVTLQDFVGTSDTNDYYRFTLTGNTNFNLLMNGLTADADVQLIRDSNGNGVVEPSEVLQISELPSTSPESISLTLGAGTYYIRVYPFGNANTFYNLNLTAGAASNPFNSQYGYGLVNAATAVPRAIGQFTPFPNQPTFGGQNDWNINMVNAPEAWAQGYTGQGVIVAVLDTGVDYNHPDLAGRIWVNTREIPNNGRDDDGNGYIDDVIGWDFAGRDNNPMDEDTHGTHVAGTIAAANNGIGSTGIAYNSRIMPVRVIGNLGPAAYHQSLANGIRYAADNGARVINLSLRTNPSGGATSTDVAIVREAVNYATSRGAVVVMAAGNYSETRPTFPARYATQAGIAVGAVDSNTRIASFSNRAGNTLINYLAGPGVNVYSTTPNNTYGFLSGTSMASPHVAGVVALMLSANPTLTPAQVASILNTTANPSVVRV